MSSKDPTSLQSSVKQVRQVAKRGASWLRGSWKRAVLAGGAACVVGAGTALAVFGLPDWEALDDLQDAIGAAPSLAELRAEVKANPKDAEAWVELGHAQFDGKNRRGALRSYAWALALDASVASERMIGNLAACYGDRCQAAADALIGKYKLTAAEPKLEPLTRSKRYSVRYGAIHTLERLGRASHNDYLRLWTADLDSPDCDVRRGAVEYLGKLGDRRAVDEIREAKKKDDEDTPWYRPSCLGGLAEDAVKQILASK